MSDDWLDDVLKRALRTGSKQGGYSYDLLELGDAKAAIQKQIKLAEIRAASEILEMMKNNNDPWRNHISVVEDYITNKEK